MTDQMLRRLEQDIAELTDRYDEGTSHGPGLLYQLEDVENRTLAKPALTCGNRYDRSVKTPAMAVTIRGRGRLVGVDVTKRNGLPNRTALIDIAGQTFGHWTVLSRVPNKRNDPVRWTCRCVCGTVKDVLGTKLRSGQSTSCRCRGMTPLDRLMSLVEVDPVTGCHVRRASQTEFGYTTFFIDGKTRNAHRASWMLQRGPIPDGMFVCHRCDNPPCVNIEHLFLGTPLDNMQDKIEKGRHRHGHEERTHCKRGHEATGACYECTKLKWARQDAKRKGQRRGKRRATAA